MKTKKFISLFFILSLLLSPFVTIPTTAKIQATTYYVSSSSGSDGNNGWTTDKPFASVNKVNSLELQPGDQVFFKCGDTWRADPLVITQSGNTGARIVFGSYPPNCDNQPVLSGSQPISGWTASSTTNIYVAALPPETFPYGINQLFRNGTRLPMGRWPDLDAGDGGYSTIESQSNNKQITDNELPADTNWAGAVMHIKNMRWSVLNRRISSNSGHTLILEENTSCWDGCAGWGYFLNNHLATLNRDGEWYADNTNHVVYLYSSSGIPDQIEGSVILTEADDNHLWGGIMLTEQGGNDVSFVTVENFAVRAWYRNGIAAPIYQPYRESHDITIRNNTISDVDRTGISLITWIGENPNDQDNGWRGGYNQTVTGNTILRANHIGIDTYARESSFINNIVRDVGLVENWGAAGMGCGYDEGDASGGICTEDGDGIRLKMYGAPDRQSHNVTVSGNRLERIAYSGIQIFSHENTIENNVIGEPCYAKGDCGGISTYSGTNLASSPVYNLTIRQNIIIDTIGNTDGCLDRFDDLFGFGLYLGDSRDTTIDGNTVISSTVHGLLLMNSSGSVTDNTFYNNGLDRPYDGSQAYLGSPPSAMSTHTGNIHFGLLPTARTLSVEDINNLGTSNNNYFFHPYRAEHIYGIGEMRSLASWQATSSKDANSKEHWYTQTDGEAPRSVIFYNDTPSSKTIDLGSRKYLDLDQSEVFGTVELEPFISIILIDNGEAGLSLSSISPTMWDVDNATAFTLTLQGTGFTANSIARWNGSDRPTTFISESALKATIYAADVSTAGEVNITVHDPGSTPNTTQPLIFNVVDELWQIYLPLTVLQYPVSNRY